jgi:hypothetical protein
MTIYPKLGLKLLRDHRVSIRSRLIALGTGAAAVGVLEVFQLPAEGVAAVLLPFVGAAGDLALDGAAAVIIATLLLPKIAPADIVHQRPRQAVLPSVVASGCRSWIWRTPPGELERECLEWDARLKMSGCADSSNPFPGSCHRWLAVSSVLWKRGFCNNIG